MAAALARNDQFCQWQMAYDKPTEGTRITTRTNKTKERNPMAKYQHFEELPVWQEAKRLYNAVLDLLEEPDVPLTSGFRNQLDRAALSVSNNVAEGFERSTTNELQAFIAIARGSSGEVRSMIAVVKDRPKLKRFIV